MKRLILLASLIPCAALAQPASQSTPPQFCISQTVAQTLAAALQQDAAMLALLNDSAQEPQRQAAAIAAALAKQAPPQAAPAKP